MVSSTTLNYGSAYTTGFFVVMNKEKWASLPADIQKIIEEINAEWIVKTVRAGMKSIRKVLICSIQRNQNDLSFQGRGCTMA